MPERARRSIRLPRYDYSREGAYFVTVCTKERECSLGMVEGRTARLSPLGLVVDQCWRWLNERYPYVNLGQWVVMPNHVHGILMVRDVRRGGSRTAPTGKVASPAKGKSLGRLIGAFKALSTKRINARRNTPGQIFWQRNFYERVIRNEKELDAIRNYIATNPLRWHSDAENPNAVGPVDLPSPWRDSDQM